MTKLNGVTPLNVTKSVRSRAAQRRGGFTLMEVLVVMGIIVLLITLAMPAFNFITGSRSGEAASNQVSAAISVARAQAVGIQQVRGVAIYHDSELDRTVAAIVETRTPTFSPWLGGAVGATVRYQFGEYRRFPNTGGASDYYWVCTDTYDDDGTQQPGSGPGDKYWRNLGPANNIDTETPAAPMTAAPSVLEVVPSAETSKLPNGVEVRSVGNTYWYKDGAKTVPFRYASPAVILFDGNGQVVSMPFRILKNGLLGRGASSGPDAKQIDFAQSTTTPFSTANQPYRAYSGVGLVVYESDLLKNAQPPLGVPYQTQSAIALREAKAKVEDWLDNNATPMMVNRYNGTLVKGD